MSHALGAMNSCFALHYACNAVPRCVDARALRCALVRRSSRAMQCLDALMLACYAVPWCVDARVLRCASVR